MNTNDEQPQIHYYEGPLWEGDFWFRPRFVPQPGMEVVKLNSVTEALARAEAKEKFGRGILLKQIEVLE